MPRDHQQWSAPVRGLPRLPTHLVPKPRIRTVLENGSSITVLRAPRGYGKSAHVVDWLLATDRTAVWYSPTDDGEDLWSGLARALVRHELADEDALATTSPDDLVRRTLTALRSPLVVVVDRFDRVSTPETETTLTALVDDAPAVSLVLCARPSEDPEVLGHLGMDTAFVETPALALTRDDVSTLATALDSPLDDAALDHLHTSLWGWPGPTRALLVRTVGDDATTAPALDWATIGPYLRGHHDPGAEASDLLATTLEIDHLTADVAQALSGNPAAARLLGSFERAGIARSAVERGTRVYTYLPALRTLPATADWSPITAISDDAHRRAVAVLGDHPELAIHHAAAAKDWDQVVEIVDSNWVTLLTRYPSRLRTVLAAVPGRFMNAMPRLITARDVFLHARDDMVSSQSIPWPAPGQTLTDSEARDVAGVAVGQIIASRTAFGYEQAAAMADRLVDSLKDADGHWRSALMDIMPFLVMQTAVAHLAAGNLAAAHRDLLTCVRLGTGTSLEFVARNAAEFAALVDAFRGNLVSAQDRLDAAERLARPPALVSSIVDPVAPVVRVLLALDKLDLDEAERQLGLLPKPGSLDHLAQTAWFFVDAERAMLAALRGDPRNGIAIVEQAREAGGPRTADGSWASRLLAATQARLTLAADNPTLASNLAVAYPVLGRDVVLRARLALHAGRWDDAVEAATSGQWRAGLSARERVALLLVDMEARHRLGDHVAAAHSLRRAVDATGPVMLQPYTAADTAVLEAVAADVPAAAAVVDALRASAVPATTTGQVPLVELSEREVAVLVELEDEASAEVIARRLFVSVNTVKSQVRSLYRKLGTTNRQAALSEAHRLGFLGLGTH